MTTQQETARRQLEQFLSTLFLPDELIEIRFIESWFSRAGKKSRVARSAEWLRRSEFISQLGDINDFARAERANVYFGVCPRCREGDSHDETKTPVSTCLHTRDCILHNYSFIIRNL